MNRKRKNTSRTPHKAVILAAGYGTRMHPLSNDLPKAVMPLWNRSLLAHNVELLHGWGVRDILVNTHHGAEHVIREACALSRSALRITVSHEPDILGTGGALRRAEWFFNKSPFWLINADVIAFLDPAPVLRRFRECRPLAALWMHESRGPRTVDIVHGRVANFESECPGAEGTQTFCGLHLLSPRILHYLPDSGFASVITAYIRAMHEGERIEAVTVPNAYWADIGTPERYLQTHKDTAHDLAPDTRHPTPDTCIAPTARVRQGASLNNCVVWDNAVIEKGARVHDAIIGRNTHITGRVSGVAVRAPLALTVSEMNALSSLGFDDATRPCTVILLPARGSARSFIRVSDTEQRIILMRYDARRIENIYYLKQARFLDKHNWPVPHVLWEPKHEWWAVLEDVGDTSLQELVAETPVDTNKRYRAVLDHVLQLHGPVTRSFRRSKIPAMPPFNAQLYRYERELFIRHYLHDLRGADSTTIDRVNRDLLRVARRLKHTAPVLLHRDLQSSNILYRGTQPVFIDFQGMRLGPAAYDVASLLCDPYVQLSRRLRENLLNYYAQQAAPQTFSIDHYRWACAQRLCQAIGAYARLGAMPGCRRFLDHIPAALALLNEVLDYVPELRALKALINP